MINNPAHLQPTLNYFKYYFSLAGLILNSKFSAHEFLMSALYKIWKRTRGNVMQKLVCNITETFLALGKS